VATASPAIIDGYDVKMPANARMTNRTSYVIAPNGRVIFAHSDMDYARHVSSTLAAVKGWKAGKR
jgi:peroxiredoxin